MEDEELEFVLDPIEFVSSALSRYRRVINSSFAGRHVFKEILLFLVKPPL
jgi:hypothetical protein